MHHMEAFPHEPQRRLLPSRFPTLPVSLPLFPAYFLASHNTCYSREGVLLRPCDPAKESRAALKEPPREREKKARVKRAWSSRKYKRIDVKSIRNYLNVGNRHFWTIRLFLTHLLYVALTMWLVCNRIAAVAPPWSCTHLRAPVVHHKTQPTKNFRLAANWIRQVFTKERSARATRSSGVFLRFILLSLGPAGPAKKPLRVLDYRPCLDSKLWLFRTTRRLPASRRSVSVRMAGWTLTISGASRCGARKSTIPSTKLRWDQPYV